MQNIRIDVYHHLVGQGEHDDQVLELVLSLIGDVQVMRASLEAALAGLQAEVTDSVGKANSILTYVQGVPAVVAAAVAKALADADVDADRAAALVDQARQSVSDAVDGVVAAVNANSPPGEPPVPPPTPAEPPVGGEVGNEGGTNDGGQPQ